MGLNPAALACERVAKTERKGMKMQARAIDIPIDGIANDRMTNPRQVRS